MARLRALEGTRVAVGTPALVAALVLAACAGNEEGEDANRYVESPQAKDQMTSDFASQSENLDLSSVDPQVLDEALASLIEVSAEEVRATRSEAVREVVAAIKEACDQRGIDCSGLDAISDETLGDDISGAFELDGVDAPPAGADESAPASDASSGVGKLEQALNEATYRKYLACPLLAPEGANGVSCAGLIDSVLGQTRLQIAAAVRERRYAGIQARLSQLRSNLCRWKDDGGRWAARRPICNAGVSVDQLQQWGGHPWQFYRYATNYLRSQINWVLGFAVNLAAVRAEYIMRLGGKCDGGKLEPKEIARLRGIEEGVGVVRGLVGLGSLVLAPQGSACRSIGSYDGRDAWYTDALISSRAKAVLRDEMCTDADISRLNPALQQLDEARRAGLWRAISHHTALIWVGVMRRGAWWRRSGYKVASVDGCSPRDRITHTTSPLVIDLAGDGLELTTDRVSFDLRATGERQRVNWTREGLLALDVDGDGRINSGEELFGDRSECGGQYCRDGAEALAVHDNPALGGDGNGRIDARDGVFERLLVWTDANQDGVSQPSELRSLAASGINGLQLKPTRLALDVPAGHISLSLPVMTDNGPRLAYDVWFHNDSSPGLLPLVAPDVLR